MRVKSLMHPSAYSCLPGDSLDTVAATMWNEDCGAMPVVDEEQRPIGILTDRDIAMSAMLKHRPLWDISVRELVAGKSVVTCHKQDDAKQALKLMAEHQIRRLPVVNDDGRLIGIIATRDLVAHTGPRADGELSFDQTVKAFQSICRPNVPLEMTA